MFIVNIMGGLGNQLFQLNFALYLRKKHPDVNIRLNTRYFKINDPHGGFLLEKFGFKLSNKRKYKNFKIIDDLTFSESFSAEDNIIFNGYWQDTKFFDASSYSFDDFFYHNISQENNDWEKKIKISQNPVSVHVRCGDYNNHILLGNIATKSYFNNAIKEIKKTVQNPTFFVFSDDVEWTKQNIDFDASEVFFVENNYLPKNNKWDLYLMGICHHHIISNSTFSWWGQQFNHYKDKIVITPPYWVNDKIGSFDASIVSIQKLPHMRSVPNVPIEQETQNKQPVFSVIVTAFNQEMRINCTISSVLNQIFSDFELIVVNDGSTDATQDTLQQFTNSNSKIKIIVHEKNKSVLEARRTGVEKSHGKYLLFLDGDDFLFPDALQKLYDEVIRNEEFDVCEFSYISRPKNEIISPKIYDLSLSRLEYFCNKNAVFTVWNKLYKSELLKRVFSEIPNIYMNFVDDSCISVHVAFFTKKFIQHDILLINYVLGTGISTQNTYTFEKNKKTALYMQENIHCLSAFLKKNNAKNAEIIVRATEQHLLSFLLDIITTKTVKSDIEKSLLMLPLYFDENALMPTFKKMYDDCKKYRNGAFSPKNFFKFYSGCFLFLLSKNHFLRTVYHKIRAR
ncbi:MAG: glycosyltransferase [Treponema sp.]|nr:glycosyltransferase [Treponema sp.]